MAKFYGIGVGPGDKDLLTLRAVKVINGLDVLLIPSTKKDKMGVAETIIKEYLKEDVERVHVDFPMVVDEKVFVEAGKKAATIIEACIKEGKNIGFVTLGDASVYSTYGYIVKALTKDIEVETVPGITSFSAAAALANRPLVEKDEILSIIPMNASDEQIHKALEIGDAFAFMKVYKREERVLNHIEQHNMTNDAILAARVGFEEETVYNEDFVQQMKENKDYLTVVLSRKERK